MSEPADFIPPPNPGDTLRRVLVIKLSAMGDFIQSLGAMRVVRATHPSARITLLTTEPFEAFAKACPYVDIVEADGRPRDIKGRTDLIRRLRNANYDMIYDFQNNDRTAQYYAGLTGKKPLWSGAAPGASHQHRNPDRMSMHSFDRLAQQLRHAGLTPKPPGDPSGWIEGQDLLPYLDWVRPAFRDPPRFKPEFFSLNGPYALLIPGSPDDQPEKRWPVDKFAAIAKWLMDLGVTPVIVGGKAENDIGNQIVRLEPRARSIVGRTDLFQLATLSERAVIAIGGDTGPMHMAAAAHCPGVCLFAQEWTRSMEMEMQSVWSPQTRLGRAAPKGGMMMVLYAESLDQLSPKDVRRAARALNVLPAESPAAIAADEIPDAPPAAKAEGSAHRPQETAALAEAAPDAHLSENQAFDAAASSDMAEIGSDRGTDPERN